MISTNKFFEFTLTGSSPKCLVTINLFEDGDPVCGCTGYEAEDFASAAMSTMWYFVKLFPEVFEETKQSNIDVSDIPDSMLPKMFGFA